MHDQRASIWQSWGLTLVLLVPEPMGSTSVLSIWAWLWETKGLRGGRRSAATEMNQRPTMGQLWSGHIPF